MKHRKVLARRWLQRCKTAWPAVFLHSHPRRLSHQTIQDHFTQYGLVLKIVQGSCGRCCLVYFARRATARQVEGVTQLVGGRELCPQLVDKTTAKHFWRSAGRCYQCDCCTPLAERDDEDRLVMEGEGEEEDEDEEEGDDDKEGAKAVGQVPCSTPAAARNLTMRLLQQMVQRERKSLLLLRHLKEQAAKDMFVKEKQSYERLQRLRRTNSRALLLSLKVEASLRLLRHLRGADGRAQELVRMEKDSRKLLGLFRHTAGGGHE